MRPFFVFLISFFILLLLIVGGIALTTDKSVVDVITSAVPTIKGSTLFSQGEGGIPPEDRISVQTTPITSETEWRNVKLNGIQDWAWDINYTWMDNDKIKVCAYPAEGYSWRVNDDETQANRAYLKSITGGQDLIEPSDMEIETEGGKVKKMCFDVDKTLYNEFQIGEHSSVYVYGNESRVVFEATENVNITAVVYKEVAGNYTIFPDEIFVYWNEPMWKFGANDTTENETSWNQYKYDIYSTAPLEKYGFGYVFRFGNAGYKVSTSDICSGINPLTNESANCQFYTYSETIGNDTFNHLEITFYSNNFIDPAYSFELVESDLLLDDVRFEGKPFTHLEINNATDNPPYHNGSLVGYWSFDADSLTKAYDLTGFDNDGTYTGNAFANQTCDSGYDGCAQFDGTGDYISFNDDDSLDLHDNFSISYWVYLPVAPDDYDYSIAKWVTTGNQRSYVAVIDTNRKFNFWHSSDGSNYKTTGGPISADAIPLNEWTHIAFTFNNGTTNIYLNGVTSNGGGSAYSSVYAGTAPTEFAKGQTAARYFNGSLDEVMFFKKALNFSQISDIYNNQSARFKDTGTATLNNTNLSDASNPNTANFTLDNYEINFGTNFSIQVDNEAIVNFTNGVVTGYDLTNISDLNSCRCWMNY